MNAAQKCIFNAVRKLSLGIRYSGSHQMHTEVQLCTLATYSLDKLVAINLDLLMAALQETNHYEMYLYSACPVMRPVLLSFE